MDGLFRSNFCVSVKAEKMPSDGTVGTPPGTPPRRPRRRTKKSRRRRHSSSSSGEDVAVSRKARKTSSTISTRDVIKLLKTFKTDSNKSSFSNNNLQNVVPEFDPSNRAQTIECWLRKVNECAAIYEWNQKQIVHYSLQKLVGLAKKWFEALPTVVYSWDDWQVKLKRAFPAEENYGQLLQEMLSRTSRNEESLREYYYDKLSLVNKCEISGKKAVDCIIHGINDRSIRTGAQALRSTEPEDLLNFLCSQKPQSFVNNKFRERTFQKSSNSGDPYTDLKTPDNPTQSDLNTYCYNCRTKGHTYSKCTKPILKCKRCSRIGHEADDCRVDLNFYKSSTKSS